MGNLDPNSPATPDSPYQIVTGANGAPLRVAPGALSDAARDGIIPKGAAPQNALPGLGNPTADAQAAGIIPGPATAPAIGQAAGVTPGAPVAGAPPQPGQSGAQPPQPGQMPPGQPQPSGGFVAPHAPGLGVGEINKLEHDTQQDNRNVRAEADRAFEDQRIVAQRQADADRMRLAEEAKVQTQAQETQARLQNNVVEAQNHAQQAVEIQQGHVNDAVAAASKWTMDPDRYINSMGPASRILTSLNLIVGGFAQGLMAGHGNPNATNPALDELHRSMNADVESQKAEYEKLRGNVQNQQNIYAQLRQKGLDSVAAAQGAKVAAIEQAKIQLQTIAAKYAPGDAQNRASATIANLEQKQADLHSDMAKTKNAQEYQYITARQNAREFNINKQMQEEQLGLRALQERDKAGKRAEIPTAEQEKINAGVGGITAILDNAEKFDKATSGYTPNWLASMFGASDTAQYQKAREANAGAVASTQEPGAKLQKALIDRAEEGTPSALTSSHSGGMTTFKNRFQEARKYLEERVAVAERQGQDAGAFREQLDKLDKKADALGLIGKEVEGGK